MSASTAYKPAHGGFPEPTSSEGVLANHRAALAHQKIASLEGLAQVELAKALKHAEAALNYIERLTEAAPESTDIKSLANVATY